MTTHQSITTNPDDAWSWCPQVVFIDGWDWRDIDPGVCIGCDRGIDGDRDYDLMYTAYPDGRHPG